MLSSNLLCTAASEFQILGYSNFSNFWDTHSNLNTKAKLWLVSKWYRCVNPLFHIVIHSWLENFVKPDFTGWQNFTDNIIDDTLGNKICTIWISVYVAGFEASVSVNEQLLNLVLVFSWKLWPDYFTAKYIDLEAYL